MVKLPILRFDLVLKTRMIYGNMRKQEKPSNLSAVLIDEVRSGTLEGVLSCLKAGADVNAVRRGETPLLAALFRMADPDLTPFLLAHGADPNRTDASGETPLMVVCRHGYADLAALLIQHGADVNAIDKGGQTALMSAVAGANCIALLTRSGADLNLRNKLGLTALDLAFKGKIHAGVVELLRAGADVQQTRFTSSRQSKAARRWVEYTAPTLLAVEEGDYPTLSELLSRGASPEARNGDDSRKPLLVTAAEGGYVEIVGLLLDHGADVNITTRPGGWSALTGASANGRDEVVSLLLRRGADVTYKMDNGKDALSYAGQLGRVTTSRLLRDHIHTH